MGEIGRTVTGGRRNKAKRVQNGKVWDVLWCMVVAKKTRKLEGPIMVTRDGQGGDLSKVMRAQFGYGNVAKVYVTQLPNN